MYTVYIVDIAYGYYTLLPPFPTFQVSPRFNFHLVVFRPSALELGSGGFICAKLAPNVFRTCP